MPRYATVVSHLSETELEQHYRTESDPVVSRRYHLIWLVVRGYSLKASAHVVGLNYDYAKDLLKAYNQNGPTALENRRKGHPHSGRTALLTPDQQEQLRERLNTPPDDGGVWTGPKVAEWIAQQTGRERVWPQRGWEYLKRLGFSWQRPRRRHVKGDPEAQAAFKTELAERLDTLRTEHPDAEIEVWASDEHRVGLQPILRKVWSLLGERPIAHVNPGYEWLYVYGYVHPASGQTEWHLLPRVNREWFAASLAEFAQAVGAGVNKLIVLQVDQAGWHTTEKLDVPDGIELIFQPPYSPEVQPAERLWSLVDEPLVNKAIESVEQLEAILAERCRVLSEHFTKAIQALTQFHWWPEQTPALEG